MKFTYRPEDAAMVFPLQYIFTDFTSKQVLDDKSTLILDDSSQKTGVIDILSYISEHSPDLLPNTTIKTCEKVIKAPIKQYLQTNKKNTNNLYTNKEGLGFLDILIFVKMYIHLRSMDPNDKKASLTKDEMSWFYLIQSEINNKIKIKQFYDFDYIEIRTGLITGVEDHPDADKLFVEDVQTNRKMTVVSGLKGVVKKEDLLGKMFLFVCNMKESTLRGVMSEGMILCGREGDVLEVISAPEGVSVGARVEIEKVGIEITSGNDDCSNSEEINNENKSIYNYKTQPSYILDGKGKILKEIMLNLKVKNNKVVYGEIPLKLEGKEIIMNMKEGTIS